MFVGSVCCRRAIICNAMQCNEKEVFRNVSPMIRHTPCRQTCQRFCCMKNRKYKFCLRRCIISVAKAFVVKSTFWPLLAAWLKSTSILSIAPRSSVMEDVLVSTKKSPFSPTHAACRGLRRFAGFNLAAAMLRIPFYSGVSLELEVYGLLQA